MNEEDKTCPHCGQRIQVYRRSITPAMFQSLVRLAYIVARARTEPPHDDVLITPTDVWVHARAFAAVRDGQQDRDYGKLRFWGLIAPCAEKTGFWGLTSLGATFLEGRTRIPRNVFLYNNQLQRVSPETVTVTEFRGEP